MRRASFISAAAMVLGLVATVRADVEGVSESLAPAVKGELIKGQTLKLNAEIVCVFKAPAPQASRWEIRSFNSSSEKKAYFYTIKDGNINRLAINPKVQAPAGVNVKILSLTVSSVKVREFSHKEYLRTESAGYRKQQMVYNNHYHIYDGYAIRCEVELTAGDGFKSGEQTVTVSLPEVEATARAFGATSPTKAPEYRFELTGWVSEAARQDALAKEREAKAQEARAKQWRIARVLLLIGAAVLGLIVLCKLFGKLSTKVGERRDRLTLPADWS